ncbi:hypothetical protein J421_4272 [Gemmatirosa kalamazoonensis]|uniref:Four helix bundle protein n=1 Tax=Gemmatirosa kalamazoonensis TaxID=861299 RepID=W0RL62_9BACT|nr:four helix bundle protein [Gemmatirosa kalamazoonensis]AHG91809.1 hypothetical protein J421_4272 [Gemmatirosa kalamazoonensis]
MVDGGMTYCGTIDGGTIDGGTINGGTIHCGTIYGGTDEAAVRFGGWWRVLAVGWVDRVVRDWGMDKRASQKRPAKSFRDLVVWQEAHKLAEFAAGICDGLPRREWSLADQLRRASSSVPFNISEGNGAPTRPDYLKYLGSARKSLNEVESQLELLRARHLAPAAQLRTLSLHISRTGRLLAALTRSLSKPPAVDRPAVDRPAVSHPAVQHPAVQHPAVRRARQRRPRTPGA